MAHGPLVENLIILDAAIEQLQTIIMFLIDEGAIEKYPEIGNSQFWHK